ncbi:MAG TPA: hypothetical protein DCR14_04925 [Acidimicrobiaceae bacterium]|nr:hypothetical protein [Acidimicrobiaceae bacterium]
MKNETPKVGGLHAAGSASWWLTVAMLAALLTAYAWTHPTTDERVVAGSYTSTFHFSYDAALPDGSDVYADNQMDFGDPVYLALVDEIIIDVDYMMRSDIPGVVDRNAEITTRLVVSSDAGWSQTLHEATTPFVGMTTAVQVPVDFDEVRQVAADLARRTGVNGPTEVALVVGVAADVYVPDRASGSTWDRSVTAGALAFDVDESAATVQGYSRLSPAEIVETIEAGAGSSPEYEAGVATSAQSTTVDVDVIERPDATVSLGSWDMDIVDLRVVSLVATLLFLAMWAYDDLVLWIARRRGEAAYLETRFGSDIYPVHTVPPEVSAEAVWLGTFEGLAAMAENADAEILHHAGPDHDRYFVFDGPRVFAYVSAARHTPVAGGAESSERVAAGEPAPAVAGGE